MDAFERLVRQFQPSVWRFLRHLLDDAALGLAAGVMGMLALQGGDHPAVPTGPVATPTASLPSRTALALFSAMNELRQRNLTGLVDPRAFGGCWNPRLIRADDGILRHAWGAALDLNVNANPTGLASAQDPRLVEVMQRWGSTSGAHWLVPDPSHFEYLQPA